MKTNQQRMEYVERWANFVINNANWSELQAELINSQIKGAESISLTREQVDYIK